MKESLDLLELELRQLPGVASVGLEDHGHRVEVRLALVAGADGGDLHQRAQVLARAHAEQPAVSVTDTRLSPGLDAGSDARVRLVAVGPGTGPEEVQVTLALGGRRAVGQGSGGLAGAVSATLEGLSGLGMAVPFRHRRAEPLRLTDDPVTTVAVVLSHEGPAGEAKGTATRYGIAPGATPEEAAARAVLNALNRHLTTGA
jgi:hypothetical protein